MIMVGFIQIRNADPLRKEHCRNTANLALILPNLKKFKLVVLKCLIVLNEHNPVLYRENYR